MCVQSDDSTKRVYSVFPSGRVWKEVSKRKENKKKRKENLNSIKCAMSEDH